jgi:hypothetical protein
MNANGLYNGLEGYIVPGTNSGMGVGVANGVVASERMIKYVNLLNQFPNASVAYSLRKLDISYQGPAIRVRRSSDNIEQDIYFDTNGNISTVQLMSHVGNSNGFISVWYDQSGNGRNATQTTNANQPRIVNSGVVDRESGNITIVFDGSTNLSNTTTGFAINNTTLLAVSSRRNSSAVNRTVLSTGILDGAVLGFGFFYDTQDEISMSSYYSAGVARTLGDYTNIINKNNLIFGVTKITGSNTWYNGGNNVSITYSSSNANTNSRIGIGARFAGADAFNPLNGTISEIIFWAGFDQSINRVGIENNINQYYKIY